MAGKLDAVLRYVSRTPLALLPEKLEEISAVLEMRARGEEVPEEQVRAVVEAAARRDRKRVESTRGVAIIPIFGTIGRRLSSMGMSSGGYDLERFHDALDAAVATADADTIILHVDSPGGAVPGVDEASRAVFDARKKKRVITVADGLMASAGFYIGSAAHEIVATVDARVGSIGVFLLHMDWSEALAKEGIKPTIIRAPEFKAEGTPYEPLTDPALAHLEQEIGDYYDLFKAAVGRNMGIDADAVAERFGKGRAFLAKRAKRMGMVHRIGTLDSVLAELGVGRTQVPGHRSEEVAPAAADEFAPAAVTATRIDGKPDVRGEDGLIHGDPPLTLAIRVDADPLIEHIETLRKSEAANWRLLTAGGLETSEEDEGQETELRDPGAGGAVSAGEQSPPESPAAPEAKENAMADTPTAAPTGAATQEDLTAMTDRLVAAERKRASDVRALARSHGLDESKAAALADEGLTVEAAATRILGEIQSRAAADPSIQVGATREGQKPFASLGEQLLAIRQAAVPTDRRVDARLMEINAAASGAGSDVPSDGGFLIQKDLAPGIVDRMYDIGEVTSRVRRIPIGANSNGLKVNAVDESSRANGSRWGGVQAYWAGEADTVTATKPKFRQMALDLKKLFGIMYMTDELIQDAVALSAIAEQAFSEELSFKAEDGVFRGTGAGQLLGFLNSGALVTVGKESAQVADTINTTNVLKMWARLWARSRKSAVWFINQEIEPQLYPLTLGSGTAVTLLYTPAGVNGNNSEFGRLMGKPVIPVEYASAIGDVGDISLVDLDQYLMIDKDGPQQAYSIHVRFLYDEQTFRVTYRVDGQPIWNKPLTPYKGASTLSPYVVLEAR